MTAIVPEQSGRKHRQAYIGTSEGAVLGIDVGWSKKKATTGLCLLKWGDRAVSWCLCRAKHDESDRLHKLKQLVNGERLLAVGIDGPLNENLEIVDRYRSVDALLSRGKFQHRGKAGPTNGGSGRYLHLHATKLAKLVTEN